MDSAFPPMFPGVPVKSVYERAGFDVNRNAARKPTSTDSHGTANPHRSRSNRSAHGKQQNTTSYSSASNRSQRSSKMSTATSPTTSMHPYGKNAEFDAASTSRLAPSRQSRPSLATIPSVPDHSEYPAESSEYNEYSHSVERQSSSNSLYKQENVRSYDLPSTTMPHSNEKPPYNDQYADVNQRLSALSFHSNQENSVPNSHVAKQSEDFDFGWPSTNNRNNNNHNMSEVSPISSASMFDRAAGCGSTASATSSADTDANRLSSSKQSHSHSHPLPPAPTVDDEPGHHNTGLDLNHEDYDELDHNNNQSISSHNEQDFYDQRESLSFSLYGGDDASRSNSRADLSSLETGLAGVSDAAPAIPPKRKRKICRGCSEPIVGKAVAAAGGQVSGKWHRDCFVCQRCFSGLHHEFYVLNDWPYCQECYHTENNSLCQVCGLGIEGDCLETFSAEDSLIKRYHCACLSCHECCEPISDSEYYTMNGQPLCSMHAEELMERNGNNSVTFEKRATRLLFV